MFALQHSPRCRNQQVIFVDTNINIDVIVCRTGIRLSEGAWCVVYLRVNTTFGAILIPARKREQVFQNLILRKITTGMVLGGGDIGKLYLLVGCTRVSCLGTPTFTYPTKYPL